MTNGRGVFSRPLGEWTIGAMVYFAYDLPRVLRNQQAGRWEPFAHEEFTAARWGSWVMARSGRRSAERARAFGMRVTPIRRNASAGGFDSRRLKARCDYVALTAPLTPETRGMIGARQIAAMKPTAVVINVGRGPVIDEAALIAALESKKIRGAALDVFETEPLPAGHPSTNSKTSCSRRTAPIILPNSRELAVRILRREFRAFSQRRAACEHGGQTCRILKSLSNTYAPRRSESAPSPNALP